MCVIVDANTFPAVFNNSDSHHLQFEPVFRHIWSGKSKMIIGGTKFRAEYNMFKKYLRLLDEMRKAGMIVYEDDEKVDALEAEIEKAFTQPDFNDKHVVALTYTANARLVCTQDNPLIGYLTRSEFYNRRKKKPLIFNERSKKLVVPSGAFKPKCRLCS